MTCGGRSCVAALLLLAGCGAPPHLGPHTGTPHTGDPGWLWDLPNHIPTPVVPADNPMTEEKVELGRLLFYDFALSIDGGRSCGICHEPAKGFTDGFVRAVGTTSQIHPRNTPSTANAAFRAPLTWLNPGLLSMEEQLLGPLLGEDPIIEMGFGGQEDVLVRRLEEQVPYPTLFAAAFPADEAPITIDNLAKAIAGYERTVLAVNAPYDGWLAGDTSAMDPSQERGRALFFGERLGCGQCHGGPFLDRPEGTVDGSAGFFNTGLYNVDGEGAYSPESPGLDAVTGDPADTGKFRTPSLRNVAVTAPYHHDGSTATLGDVLDAYARGGRNVSSGPSPGDGALNPYKDPRIHGFEFRGTERDDVLAFLEALTDTAAMVDPRFQDPFCRDTPDDPVHCVVPWSPP
jgi:cytochrome c peroxidase